VFSEICAGIDRRNAVKQHIHPHIRDFIAIDVGLRNGRLVDRDDPRAFLRTDGSVSQELIVDGKKLRRATAEWRYVVILQKPISREAAADLGSASVA
jgi:hypothetical protein